MDDLDQVERFDLGDTRHTRGSGRGSIVEELEEIYDTLRLNDTDGDADEAPHQQAASAPPPSATAAPSQTLRYPVIEGAASRPKTLEVEMTDLEEIRA